MPKEAPISVSQLNRRVKTLIEKGIARLWVEGEISNLSRPASGHIYFSLKDDSAQVSAAWFRQRQRGPAVGYKDGDHVLAYGRVSIYEARGNYQLIVEQMEPAGEGVLKRRFEALKKKLQAEGLFDEALKQVLRKEPGNSFAWRLTAIAYGRQGDKGMTSLALAEGALARGQAGEARQQANRAKQILPENTPAWLRAQDVANLAERLAKRSN